MENTNKHQKFSKHNGKAFGLAIVDVLNHEGFFSNDSDDPGGATKYGISLRFLIGLKDSDGDGFFDGDLNMDGVVDIEDIRNMSKQEAVDLYYNCFWKPGGFNDLPSHISPKLFDLAVNMGTKQANKILQRALRSCGFPLVDDGIIGSKTLRSIHHADDKSLMAATRSEAASFYRYLVASKKAHSKYLNGWLNRAYA